MSINPIQFSHQVCDEFLRYLFSAFPLTDPELEKQARELLERPSSLDIPLVKGPYVSLAEQFAEGRSLREMADEGALHRVLPDLTGHPTMYLHQQKVYEAVKAGSQVLISTGTGSGKTEAFLYPIVDHLLRERDAGIREGLSAILVYPMNALANDQLDRLREMLAGTEISFGQWVGPTPAKESDARSELFTGGSRDAYLRERAERKRRAHERDISLPPLAPPEECRSEESIRERRPRILITNYRQLEVLTTRKDVSLFAGSPLRYMVFDEAHTYSGTMGAEVACLIRRLRLLAGKKSDEVICIGTSATLTDPEKKDDDAAAIRFASRFFGIDPEKVALVGEAYVRREWPLERHKPAAPVGDGMERLGGLLRSLEEPVDLPVVGEIVEELTGQSFSPDEDWQVKLHQLLLRNDYAYHCSAVLTRPQRLDEGAWFVSQRVAPDRLPRGSEASAELLAYLLLGAAARDHDAPLLRPKVHLFIRGLDEMVVALNGEGAKCDIKLFMSIADAREQYPDRRDDAFFPVLTCRNCGQHFFERYYGSLSAERDSRRRVRGFTGGDAVDDGSGEVNAFWSPVPPEDGALMRFTNMLLEEADEALGTAPRRRQQTAYVCKHCGAMHRDPAPRCLADGCGHEEPPVRLYAFEGVMSSCPTCGSGSINIGGRHVEPIRKVRAVPVADIHVLAQAMLNSAPERHKKLVVFADSRQDAAFQAGWIQDHGRRIRLRHLIYRAIRESSKPLSLGAITDELKAIFVKDKRLVDVLLPELSGPDAALIFGHDIKKNVAQVLKYMVLREFTSGIRRRECLESLGIARVDYLGLVPDNPAVSHWAELLGIEPEEAVNGISLLLDIWRRNRYFYVPDEAIYTKYHKKDDEYILAGLLPLKDFHPRGLKLRAGKNERYVKGVLAPRRRSGEQGLVSKWIISPEVDIDAAVTELWRLLTEDLKLLSPVIISNSKGGFLAEAHQVDSEKVRISKEWSKHRCLKCQRIMPRSAPKNACTTYRCDSLTIHEQPDESNYDVAMMHKEFLAVNAEEHTAQVPGSEREKIEREFKSEEGRVNCLVATPTLELGVNIGTLDMVLMRNVPPLPTNYWQRAGRAGREERMAVVLTYCRNLAHDRYFFDDPLRLLGGNIEAPAFNLKNPVLIAKHIRSTLISELTLQKTGSEAESERARQVLDIAFPAFIREYLQDAAGKYLYQIPDISEFNRFVAENADRLTKLVESLFAEYWPEEARELTTSSHLGSVVRHSADDLEIVIRRIHNRFLWALKTQGELNDKEKTQDLEKEEKALQERCRIYISKIKSSDNQTYTLNVLGAEGYLPGYGIYDGGITAYVKHGFARHPGPVTFELSRSAIIGLREFVPGNRLYANRASFYVSRYHLPVDRAVELETLRVNPEKGIVSEVAAGSDYGHSGEYTIEAMPITDLDLAHEGRITEEESLRFSMPVTILGRLMDQHSGGKAIHMGDLMVHHVHNQLIQLVNVGEASRVRRGKLGFLVCPVCGAAQSPYAVERRITSFIEYHQEMEGRSPLPLAFTAEVEVDILHFLDLDSERDAINIGESLRVAAAQLLDMGLEDLQLLVIPRGEERTDLVVYDQMPGGSGLLNQMLDRWGELISTANTLLNTCKNSCETACYACLKTFRNQYYHSLLDRHHAIDLLTKLDHHPVIDGAIPELSGQEHDTAGSPSNTAESRLLQMIIDYKLPKGECRRPVKTSLGFDTVPDWVYEDKTNSDVKVAVYLDGMSRNLHGDPKRAEKDNLIRKAIELDGYQVIVVQSKDLSDPRVMSMHLDKIAKAIGKPGSQE